MGKHEVVSEWARINIDAIAIPDRLRTLHEDGIAELVDSFGEVGQLNPITVRPQRGVAGYVLIAGRRRLEAAKRSRWKIIYCIVKRDLDADKAELAEIDENLMRAELTLAERAAHVARRKTLYEKAHPETKHGGDRKSPGSSSQDENLKSFVADTAKKTGKGRSTLARDVTRANKVVVLDEIVGTTLDEGAELDAMAKLPEAEQRELARRAKAGEKVSAKPAKPTGMQRLEALEKHYGISHAEPACSAQSAAETPAAATLAAGPYSESEHDRLRTRIDELGAENRRLEIQIVGLKSEVEELKELNAGLKEHIAKLVETAPAVEPATDPLGADLDVRDFAGGSLRR